MQLGSISEQSGILVGNKKLKCLKELSRQTVRSEVQFPARQDALHTCNGKANESIKFIAAG